MSRSRSKPRNAGRVITIESKEIKKDDVGPVTVIVFKDPDGRVVVDSGTDTWEFAINDEIAHSRWKISRLPDWIELVLTSIGIRAIRTDQEGV